jgi:carboxymethylenebutenolidase
VITAPILAIMGGADDGLPATEVTAFDTALGRAGVEHDVVVYPGAPHGFFDVEHREFAGAWQRTLGFIAKHGVHD